MDSGGRPETPRTYVKASLFLIAIAIAMYKHLCLFPEFHYSQIEAKRARLQLHIQWVVLQERNPKSFTMDSKSPWPFPLRKKVFILLNSKYFFPLLQKETLYPPRLYSIRYPWKDTPEQREFSASACKMFRNGKRAMKDCLQHTWNAITPS